MHSRDGPPCISKVLRVQCGTTVILCLSCSRPALSSYKLALGHFYVTPYRRTFPHHASLRSGPARPTRTFGPDAMMNHHQPALTPKPKNPPTSPEPRGRGSFWRLSRRGFPTDKSSNSNQTLKDQQQWFGHGSGCDGRRQGITPSSRLHTCNMYGLQWPALLFGVRSLLSSPTTGWGFPRTECGVLVNIFCQSDTPLERTLSHGGHLMDA